MIRPIIFLFGYVRFRAPREYAEAVVELCRKRGRVYRNFSFEEENITFECSAASERGFSRMLADAQIPVEVVLRQGLPAIFWRYRRRYGAFVGIILFLFIILFSGQLVWDVRVVGNSRLTEEEVEAVLDECGLSVGMPWRGLETPVIETRALMASEDIAWISINLLGSIAEVQIREDIPIPPEDMYFVADLVAERGGVIEWLEDTRGYQIAEIGQRVEEGDILISGTYPEDEDLAARYTVAKGRVYARTEREFSVSIPLQYERKQYTGREKCEKFIIFFKKEVKFFGNSRNLYTECDTIDTVEYIELPGGITLPFGIRSVRYLEYETVGAVRSEESAVELALYTLRCEMESAVPEGMLMKKSLSAELTDTEYILRCRAEYIENIATVKGE